MRQAEPDVRVALRPELQGQAWGTAGVQERLRGCEDASGMRQAEPDVHVALGPWAAAGAFSGTRAYPLHRRFRQPHGGSVRRMGKVLGRCGRTELGGQRPRLLEVGPMWHLQRGRVRSEEGKFGHDILRLLQINLSRPS